MTSHFRLVPLLLLLAIAVARPAWAQEPAAQAPTVTPAPDTAAATIQAGRKIFHGPGGCYACHGGKLEGGPVAPALTGPRFRNIDGSFPAILHVVQNGVPNTAMVAHPGGIDDRQTVQVANYVYAVIHGQAKP